MSKTYRLKAGEIVPLAPGRGGCIASDHITVHGLPVRFMYRTHPENANDSGWCFFSGLEDEPYTDNPANLGIYDVNTIANYDPSIIEFLDAPPGSVFEKPENCFRIVTDWSPFEH